MSWCLGYIADAIIVMSLYPGGETFTPTDTLTVKGGDPINSQSIWGASELS
ncbi:MAG: hypothetical protein ACI9FB_000248 [Candidatus Azotimanducaceae bacterium]|jgi:hypothetical protein